MRKLLLGSLVFLFASSFAQPQYFPKLALNTRADMDIFLQQWYGDQLRALHEPSLTALAETSSTECYRFLWLRTFHHPVSVRLDVRQDGTGVLTTKIASGAGGYRPGILSENKVRTVSKDEAQAFLLKLQGTDFWHIPNPVLEPTGDDGSRWIIEGVKSGLYHVVDRWTPRSGAVHDLGMMLIFDLAHIDVPKKEIY